MHKKSLLILVLHENILRPVRGTWTEAQGTAKERMRCGERVSQTTRHAKQLAHLGSVHKRLPRNLSFWLEVFWIDVEKAGLVRQH